MSLAFHITDATIHVIGLVVLNMTLLLIVVGGLAFVAHVLYTLGFQRGVESVGRKATPKAATKEEATKK